MKIFKPLAVTHIGELRVSLNQSIFTNSFTVVYTVAVHDPEIRDAISSSEFHDRADAVRYFTRTCSLLLGTDDP